ncbi:MAG: adenosine deaminase family protein [Candidatus Marinimicrobia bacterium]|nr:adenosine deaminase family protein [Candidatus Neomarinimicrobiota bacterium]
MNKNKFTEKLYNEEFLLKIPKTDLHLHLDGSLRLSTLIELAKKDGVKLPSYSEAGLKKEVFKDSYNSLDEYLRGFAYTCDVMRTKSSVERVSYELAIDNQNEGVRYIEVRLAPQTLMSDNMSFEDVMNSMWKGLEKAKKEFNSQSKIIDGSEPKFDYGIIVCAMRFCDERFSPFFKSFFNNHKYSTSLETINLVSKELAKATTKMVNETKIPIVGFDLAGAEEGFPADNHIQSYDIVHRNFLSKTVHAGEAYGPESIFQAITDLHADRIGHGFYLFDEGKVVGKKNRKNAKNYVKNLAKYIANNRITLEICPTSNLQTNPDLKGSLKNHPMKKMIENKLSITINTDNRLISNTTVTKELQLVIKELKITPAQLKNIIIYGFKRSFYYGSYVEKRKYVRGIINYYNKITNEFLGGLT